MDGVDDLGVVDPLKVDGRDPEVGVAELPLDDVQGHALARHLDGVRVAQLVRSEAAPHPGLRCRAPQLLTDARRGQRPTAGATVEDAEQRPTGICTR